MPTPPKRRPAREQSLPESERALLSTLKGFLLYRRVFLLFEAGWTLRSIGEAFDPVRSRSTVQAWVNRGREVTESDTFPHILTPEYVTPAVYVPVRPASPGIPPDELARIQELAPIAKRYRASMNPRHRAAVANDELTALYGRLRSEGVSLGELANAAGVSYRAIAKRLDRI